MFYFTDERVAITRERAMKRNLSAHVYIMLQAKDTFRRVIKNERI